MVVAISLVCCGFGVEIAVRLQIRADV